MSLAPYTDAMRLGMGFNSYTQELCIDNAVVTTGTKLPYTEGNPRPRYTPANSNKEIPQDVKWDAKFVNRVSEVTNSLNVSGALSITLDAIGGGGSASASFVDVNKFKDSDINYFIQVKVTNYRFDAPSLTDFAPMETLDKSKFTETYGDSFISGFTEGGEFNALVSIKLNDSSKKKDISGKLAIDLKFSAVKVGGSGDGGKKDESSKIDGDTTITISWSGGGSIMDGIVGVENLKVGGTVVDWSLDNLKKVAMEFPGHVKTCPMLTNAILTKYTKLRTFVEWQNANKATALDYQETRFYTSTLLDAYMDYKFLWRRIKTSIREVQAGKAEVIANEENCQLLEDEKDEGKKPYKPNILGLARAMKGCTSQMRKIVKEVAAVTKKPELASDEDREAYTTPEEFRIRVPDIHNTLTGFCPAPNGSPVQLCSLVALKSLTFDWNEGKGSKKVGLWTTQERSPSQEWTIERSPKMVGYSIRHSSGFFLALGERDKSTDYLYLTAQQPKGTPFIFKDLGDDKFHILIASQQDWTLSYNRDDASYRSNQFPDGTRLVMHYGTKTKADAWFVVPQANK